ncbi:DcrB-related protein [Paramixta manurensis]|uniref:DcrB-related protein n=1 Tax=Paramixta manurensis TaxID=2740817 RepID=UPI0033994F8D
MVRISPLIRWPNLLCHYNNLLHGECVHASYLRDGRRMFQQQAVFNTAENHILVFTMTGNTTLTDTDNQHFQALLASFCFNA